SNVELYGLWLRNFYDPNVGNYGGVAISLYNVNDLKIGRPGGGNVFTNNPENVSQYLHSQQDSTMSTNLVFQSNFFGLDTSVSNAMAVLFWMYSPIWIENGSNITFGGPDSTYGNYLADGGIRFYLRKTQG